MQTGSFVYSTTWSSNFYFAFAEFDYFAALRAKDFFLHTWSLGIEEQFYIVWPWLVMFSFLIAARTSRPDSNLTLFFAITAIVFVSSLGLCLYWSQTNQLLAFYMMPSRGWQFALGASVFVYSQTHRTEYSGGLTYPWSITARQLTGIAGLLLIVGSAVLLHRELTYPSYLALFPSVGAALTLLAGTERKQSIPNKMLSNKVFVWLGDRSYSLYLWHWPVLLFGDAYGLTNHVLYTVALIAGSVFLAALSYHFVERPFWKGRFSIASPRLVVASSALAMVAMVGASQWFVVDEFTNTADLIYQDEDNFRPDNSEVFVTGFDCDSWFSSATVVPCSTGDDKARRTAVLIGDSIGAQWASFLPEIYTAPEWRVLALTKSACAIADVEYYYKPVGGLYDVCTAWRNAVIEYIAELKPDIVFVGSSTGYNFSESQWVGGTERVMTKLASVARRVIIIPGTPTLSFDGPSCIKQPYRFTARLRDSEYICEEALTSTASDEVAEYLEKAAAGIPNADLLNLNDLVCPGRRCAARNNDGLTVFRDDKHLTPSFVLAQTAVVLSRLNSIGVGPSFLKERVELVSTE